MQRAGPLHPSRSLLLEFRLGIHFVRLLFRFLDCVQKLSVRGFTTTTKRSDFDFRKLFFDSGRAGALPSYANVCKRPKQTSFGVPAARPVELTRPRHILGIGSWVQIMLKMCQEYNSFRTSIYYHFNVSPLRPVILFIKIKSFEFLFIFRLIRFIAIGKKGKQSFIKVYLKGNCEVAAVSFNLIHTIHDG
jgi:hypothetical protein